MDVQVRIEEIEGLGAVVIGRYGDRVRVAVDPDVDATVVEVLLSIYVG